MNKISIDQINYRLNQDYRAAIDAFPHNSVLGVFVYGDANYGYAESIADLKTEIIYLPSFEEMCLHIEPISTKLVVAAHEVRVKDFRLMNKMALGNNYQIEALFTKYYILNSRYEQIYNDILRTQRQTIAYCNHDSKLYSLAQYLKDKFTSLKIATSKAAIKKYTTSILRGYNLFNKYSKGYDFIDCLTITDKFYEQQILKAKNGNINDSLLGSIKEDIQYYLATHTHPEKFEIPAEIQQAIIATLSAVAFDNNNIDSFLQKATEAEITALKAVGSEIGQEGSIAISKMVEKTGISRPVFTSLLNKLKDSKLAEIESHGPKGTSIKFNNYSVLFGAIDKDAS